MTSPVDDEDEEAIANRSKKSGDGEGDSDSFGRGKAGAGAGIAKLSAAKMTEVKDAVRHLIGDDLIGALVEFCEKPYRASVNCVVEFVDEVKKTVKAFPQVNWLMDAIDSIALEFARTREASAARDSRGVNRQKPRISPGMMPGPAGPNGQ